MRRARIAAAKKALPYAVAVAIMTAFFLSVVGVAYSDDRGDVLPGLPTAVINAVKDRGYGLYVLDQRSSDYPGFRHSLEAVYAQQCAYAGLCWYEAGLGEPYDLAHTMPFSWTAGSGVAGLAYYTLYPARIEYNWRLNYVFWDTTNSHEHGHVDGQEDLYQHAGFLCLPQNTWTRMSCATGVRTVTEYDRYIIHDVYLPDLPSIAIATRLDADTVRISYSGIRAGAVGCLYDDPDDNCGSHYSQYLDNVVEVAIYEWWDGEWHVIGYGPAPGAMGLTHVEIKDITGWIAVHPENALSITWFNLEDYVPYVSGDLAEVGAP